MDQFEELKGLRDEYEESLDEMDAKRAALHRLIRKLYLAGTPLRQIADAVGMSHQRIHQIVGEERPKSRRKLRRGGIAVLLVLALAGGGALVAHNAWKERLAVASCARVRTGPDTGRVFVISVRGQQRAEALRVELVHDVGMAPRLNKREPVLFGPWGKPAIPRVGEPCEYMQRKSDVIQTLYDVQPGGSMEWHFKQGDPEV